MATLLINAREALEPRAALVVDGELTELLRVPAGEEPRPGDLCRGRVVNLERAVGAAFVDIGGSVNGFLHVSDMPGVAGEGEERARIEDHVSLGDDILVQVTRAAVGDKGPAVTGNLSLPGRYLVLLPRTAESGVSRRIRDATERARLRDWADAVVAEHGCGVILRTAAEEADEPALGADLARLRARWEGVERLAGEATGARLLAREEDVAARAIREWGTPDLDRILVDDADALEAACEAARLFGLAPPVRVELYDGQPPIFHAFDVERQIDALGRPRVPLPSGAHLVFERTEALLSIDVNSGRSRGGEFLESTAHATNLEALPEIARQLRLRDAGGLIVVDFIDMRDQGHIEEIDREFRAALRHDRARVQSGGLGAFALFTLTRRRRGPASRGLTDACPACGAERTGGDPALTALRVWREILARRAREPRLALGARLAPAPAAVLESMLGALSGPPVAVVADPEMASGGWAVHS